MAAALGLNADSVRAQIARQFGGRGGTRPSRPAGGADSSHARRPGAGGGRPGVGRTQRQRRSDREPVQAAGSARAGAAERRERPAPERGQAVLVKTARGLEPRLVRIGLSDFDYAEILGGLNEGDEVVLLSVVEQQAKRTEDQTQIRQRLGSGVPGAPGTAAPARRRTLTCFSGKP